MQVMGHNCKIQAAWLEKYRLWLTKKTENVGYCKLCMKEIHVATNGVQALEKHAASKKHQKNTEIKLSQNQTRITVTNKNETNQQKPNGIQKDVGLEVFTLKEDVIKSEIIWTLKNVCSHMSARSCDDLPEVFNAMFHCEISENFTMSQTKVSYYITDAIGPYFKRHMLNDLLKSFYTLSYDETTNVKDTKELQIRARYWSTEEDNIVSKHLETYFIGSATAYDLMFYLNKSIDDGGLTKSKLLQLGSDGPNVNKSVFKTMNEEVKLIRNKPLIDIGSCDLHICHNAFKKGLSEYGEDVEDFIINIHYFFEGWPKRQEDLNMTQKELKMKQHKIIKHVTSRWLSLAPAIERIIEQWDALKKYFLNFVPKKRTTLMKTDKYKNIKKCFDNPVFKARVYFVLHSAKLFIFFEKAFQKDEPLIHLLYDELVNLLKMILSQFCKDTLQFNPSKDKSDVIFDNKNYVDLKKIDIGIEAKNELNALRESDRLPFYQGAKNHYIAAAKHLFNKSVLKSGSFLKHCRYLNPSKIKESSPENISYIANKLPLDSLIDQNFLNTEWRMLKSETTVIHYKESGGINSAVPFWRQIFKIKQADNLALKYPNVTIVVKAALALSHGNADVERGFSVSGNVMTDDKAAMLCRTLNSRLNILDAMKRYSYKPWLVPVPKELIRMASQAHRAYKTYLQMENEKTKIVEKEEEERQRSNAVEQEALEKLTKEKTSIEDLEKNMKEKQRTNREQLKAADVLFKEANERLQKAINKGDLAEIRVVQGLLNGYNNIMAENTKRDDEYKKLAENVNKRKNQLVEGLASSAKKKLKNA